MAAPNRFRRVRSQLPTCYYEGFLEKKSIKDKMGRTLWTSLCGNALFFYNNTKDSVAPSLEARELWKGFMLSVSKLSVPSSLNLLPGQIHMMKEIIEKEKIRQRLLSSPPPPSASANYVTLQSDMPSCYHNVNRVEAEYLLERNTVRGNLLLRPGHDGTSFALTTRQDINGRPVFRHYRVSRRHEGGFAIALETPITCETLHDVINCLLEKTNGVLVPLLMEEHYEKNITFIETDKENGERNVLCPKVPSPAPPMPPQKPAFVETEKDHVDTSVDYPKCPSPTPPMPPPKPACLAPRNQRSQSETNTHERTYLNVSITVCLCFPDVGEYEVDQAACPPPPVLPRLQDAERKALVPPGYSKTTSRSNSLSSTPKNVPKRQHVDIHELQEVLNRRRNQD
ncbi:hypothetical protein cypCar_00020637 [Cyprinus carpio]|nr:hypothetical protein cypCar_00020637 [Cyprinus carpio]